MAAKLVALSSRWGCTTAEAVRRAVDIAASVESAVLPVIERLDRIEARMAAGGAVPPAAAQVNDAVRAATAALIAWGDDD